MTKKQAECSLGPCKHLSLCGCHDKSTTNHGHSHLFYVCGDYIREHSTSITNTLYTVHCLFYSSQLLQPFWLIHIVRWTFFNEGEGQAAGSFLLHQFEIESKILYNRATIN